MKTYWIRLSKGTVNEGLPWRIEDSETGDVFLVKSIQSEIPFSTMQTEDEVYSIEATGFLYILAHKAYLKASS